MSTLDNVLADLADADRECAYVTVQRKPLEELIEQWSQRGDQIAAFHELLAKVQSELTRAWAAGQPWALQTNGSGGEKQHILRALNSALTESAPTLAQHRHAIRRAFVARIRRVLRAVSSELSNRFSEELGAGHLEVAHRLESDRQTIQIVANSIDAALNCVLQEELQAAEGHGG
jgi:hypothetical protein